MCSNYRPPSRESIEEYFGAPLHAAEFRLETYPGYEAPFLRLSKESNQLECVLGNFGLLPHWAKSPALARSTYNARTETVAEKPSYRNAWKKLQHCIVPVSHFYEPNYEAGKPVRWKIFRKDSRPLGIAGLWEWRPAADNPEGALSFTLLTVNAASHSLMNRFHAPDDEKRMIVILDENDYDAWLRADAANSMSFMRQYPADALGAAPAPRPPKGTKEQLAA